MNHGKTIVNHLINDTFDENICFVCLSQLEDSCENIFTSVCKDDREYCVADVLRTVLKLEIKDDDNFHVCPNCFIGALTVYKFYMQVQRSQELLNHYTMCVISQSEYILGNEASYEEATMACVNLGGYNPSVKEFNIDLGLFASSYIKATDDIDDKADDTHINRVEEDTGDILIIKSERDESLFYQIDESGNLTEITNEEALKARLNVNNDIKDTEEVKTKRCDEDKGRFYQIDKQVTLIEVSDQDMVNLDGSNISVDYERKKRKPYIKKQEERKKRSPMEYITCTECPIKYRFISKLREHIKLDHNIDVFICKICKEMLRNEQEYYAHLMSHVNTYVCAICGVAVKKRKTMIAHLQKHERAKNLQRNTGAQCCEICGEFQPDWEKLREHIDLKHNKKCICFYCGKSYKSHGSLDLHIKKHEIFKNNNFSCNLCEDTFPTKDLLHSHMDSGHQVAMFKCKKCTESFFTKKELREHSDKHREFYCEKCSRSFVDARALMWHQRLHNNERPYVCEKCGRGFVSANRRNQHMICAHTAPTRRCPICPSLFHLRSMVNTHIRKVHLQEHRRRNRESKDAKNRDVYWRTEVVPLQDLSVEIQNGLLDLQTKTEVDEDNI